MVTIKYALYILICNAINAIADVASVNANLYHSEFLVIIMLMYQNYVLVRDRQ